MYHRKKKTSASDGGAYATKPSRLPLYVPFFFFQIFGLKLTPGELGAMMKEFDKDGDGTVNCAEFLLTFFRIGFDSRNRALQR